MTWDKFDPYERAEQNKYSWLKEDEKIINDNEGEEVKGY